MESRIESLDLMRVWAAFAVVVLHTSANLVTVTPDVSSTGWWAANIFDSFSRWCVPIFVMISGSLLLPSKSTESVTHFYKKRMLKIIYPLIFWTFFYILLGVIIKHSFSPKEALRSIVTGAPFYHLWYLYMLPGLYLVTPFLARTVKEIQPKYYLILIIGCLTLASVETSIEILLGLRNGTFLKLFIPFIGYFFAGHYLHTTGSKVKTSTLLVIFLACGMLIAILTSILLPKIGLKSWEIMYSYFNPFVIVMSISIFLVFNRVKPIFSYVPKLAQATLGIYLIHPFILLILKDFHLTGSIFHPAIGIPLISSSAFITSAIITSLFLKSSILRKLVL